MNLEFEITLEGEWSYGTILEIAHSNYRNGTRLKFLQAEKDGDIFNLNCEQKTDTTIRCTFIKYRIDAGVYTFKNNMLILANGMSENFILNYTVYNENDNPNQGSTDSSVRYLSSLHLFRPGLVGGPHCGLHRLWILDQSWNSEMIEIPVKMLYKDTVFADTLKDNEPNSVLRFFTHQSMTNYLLSFSQQLTVINQGPAVLNSSEAIMRIPACMKDGTRPISNLLTIEPRLDPLNLFNEDKEKGNWKFCKLKNRSSLKICEPEISHRGIHDLITGEVIQKKLHPTEVSCKHPEVQKCAEFVCTLREFQPYTRSESKSHMTIELEELQIDRDFVQTLLVQDSHLDNLQIKTEFEFIPQTFSYKVPSNPSFTRPRLVILMAAYDIRYIQGSGK